MRGKTTKSESKSAPQRTAAPNKRRQAAGALSWADCLEPQREYFALDITNVSSYSLVGMEFTRYRLNRGRKKLSHVKILMLTGDGESRASRPGRAFMSAVMDLLHNLRVECPFQRRKQGNSGWLKKIPAS